MAQMIFSLVFILGGLFFLSVSSIGIIRLPDFYSRNHAVGKSETLGAMLIFAGLVIYNGFELSSVKLLIILLFIAVGNPTATHIVARAAYHSGLSPWVRFGQPATSNESENRAYNRNEEEKTTLGDRL